jgi:hypothetical protein
LAPLHTLKFAHLICNSESHCKRTVKDKAKL